MPIDSAAGSVWRELRLLETLQTKGFREILGLALVLLRGCSELPKLEKTNRKKRFAG